MIQREQAFFSNYSTSSTNEALVTFLQAYLQFLSSTFSYFGDVEKLWNFHINLVTQDFTCLVRSAHFGAAEYHFDHLNFKKTLHHCYESLNADCVESTKVITYALMAFAHLRLQNLKKALKFTKLALKHESKLDLESLHVIRLKGVQAVYELLRHRKNWKNIIRNHVPELIKAQKTALRVRTKLPSEQRVLIRNLLLQRSCAFCEEVQTSLEKCAGCEQVYYCSKAHQKTLEETQKLL